MVLEFTLVLVFMWQIGQQTQWDFRSTDGVIGYTTPYVSLYLAGIKVFTPIMSLGVIS